MGIKEVLFKLRSIPAGGKAIVNGHVVVKKWVPNDYHKGRVVFRREPLYMVDAWGKTPLYEERAAYACVTKGRYAK